MRVPGRRLLAALVALGIVVFYLHLLFGLLRPVLGDPKAPTPYVGGVLALVLVYSMYVAFAGDHRIWNAAKGEDGRASTSKFQVLLWFGVVLFAYVAAVTGRIQAGEAAPLPGIPANVLIALGISIGTLTGAAAVTAGQVSAGKEVKTQTDDKGLAPLVQTDDGRPDLGKIQLLAWTIVAIGVFLAELARVMPTPEQLPDIDSALLVLTGLGSATYLGGKLVSTATAYIASIDRNTARSGETRKLIGANFGTAGRLRLGGVELQSGAISWSDTAIEFAVPARKPDGTAWPADTPLELAVLSPTGASANTVMLTLTT